MKNHIMVGSRLLQTNKKWSHLKHGRKNAALTVDLFRRRGNIGGKVCKVLSVCSAVEREAIEVKLSARNQWRGKVVSVTEGAVNGVVVLDIGGGNNVTATISMAAIKELNLKVGGEAYAIVKATSVMVGTD